LKELFTDAQIADFLRRSYFVVDGLWFIMAEQERGFDEAMDLDEAVWGVMSKVQARRAKEVLRIELFNLNLHLKDMTSKSSLRVTRLRSSCEPARGTKS